MCDPTGIGMLLFASNKQAEHKAARQAEEAAEAIRKRKDMLAMNKAKSRKGRIAPGEGRATGRSILNVSSYA